MFFIRKFKNITLEYYIKYGGIFFLSFSRTFHMIFSYHLRKTGIRIYSTIVEKAFGVVYNKK